MLALAVGLIILTVLTSLPVQALGFIVSLAIIFLGLGALALNIGRLRFKTGQRSAR